MSFIEREPASRFASTRRVETSASRPRLGHRFEMQIGQSTLTRDAFGLRPARTYSFGKTSSMTAVRCQPPVRRGDRSLPSAISLAPDHDHQSLLLICLAREAEKSMDSLNEFAGSSWQKNDSELREITSYRNAITIVTVIAFPRVCLNKQRFNGFDSIKRIMKQT